MPATATRPSTVANDQRVKAEQAKLDNLRRQLSAAQRELDALQRSPDNTAAEAAAVAADHIRQGVSVDEAIDVADNSHEIPRARARVDALVKAVEGQERDTAEVTRQVANEVRESLRPEFNEKLLSVAHSVQAMLGAIHDLGGFVREAQVAGANYELGHYRPVLGPIDATNVFRLPQPEQAERSYSRYYNHVAKHLPNVAKHVDGSL